MERLPDEIWLAIINMIDDKKDRKPCLFVDHKFRSLAEECLTFAPRINGPDIPTRFSVPNAVYKNITSLSIDFGSDQPSDQSLPWNSRNELWRRCSFKQHFQGATAEDGKMQRRTKLILGDLPPDATSTPHSLPALAKLCISTEIFAKPDDPVTILYRFSGLRDISIEADTVLLPTTKIWGDLETFKLIWGENNDSVTLSLEEGLHRSSNLGENLRAFLQSHGKVKTLYSTVYGTCSLMPYWFRDRLQQDLSAEFDENTAQRIVYEAAKGLQAHDMEYVRAKKIHTLLGKVPEATMSAHFAVFNRYGHDLAWYGAGWRGRYVPGNIKCTHTFRPTREFESAIQGNGDSLDTAPWDDKTSVMQFKASGTGGCDLFEIRSSRMIDYYKNRNQ